MYKNLVSAVVVVVVKVAKERRGEERSAVQGDTGVRKEVVVVKSSGNNGKALFVVRPPHGMASSPYDSYTHSPWKVPESLTIKGWSRLDRMFFSEIMCSTCCRRMTSAFFNILIAQHDPVDLCVTNLTLPNDPVPKVTPMSKSVRFNGDGNVLTTAAMLLDRPEAQTIQKFWKANQPLIFFNPLESTFNSPCRSVLSWNSSVVVEGGRRGDLTVKTPTSRYEIKLLPLR